jgi:hypothetical protein
MPRSLRLASLLLCLVIAAGTAATPAIPESRGPAPQPQARAGWTFLLFSMADCNLEAPMLENLREMADVGSNENVNFVVLVDRAAGYTNEPLLNIPDFTTAKYLVALKGSFREIKDLGELDMGDPRNLTDFITWGVTNFPARKYALIFSDHGGAWPGFGGDESTENGNSLDMGKFKQALSQGLKQAGLPKFDLIGFDACLMQTLETAATFRPYADYFVASEETEPGHGWDYRSLKILRDNPEATPVQLGKAIIDGFEGAAKKNETDNEITLSMLDLSKLSRVESLIKDLRVQADSAIKANSADIGRARAKTNAYGKNPDPAGCVNTIDVGHFASLLEKSDPQFAPVCDKIRSALSEAVIYMKNGSGQRNSSGLAAYFPDKKRYYDADYDQLPEAGVWRDLLRSYYGAGAALPPEEHADLTNADDLAEVGIDEAGNVEIAGKISDASMKNIVDVTLQFGLVVGDDIFVLGDMTGDISEDRVASGSYPLEIMFIKNGGKKAYGYISYAVDGDEVEISMPFHYYPPGSKKFLEAFSLISGNVKEPDENWEQIYYVEESDGNYGELELEEGGRVVPLLLKLAKPDAKIQDDVWVETDPVKFNAKKDLEIDFEKLGGGETIYLQLIAEDFGGNSDFVYYQGPIPKKKAPAALSLRLPHPARRNFK